MLKKISKKTVIAILCLLCVMVGIIVQKIGERYMEDINFLSLTLNQGNAYIAISQNDNSGYNRWIPFYFLYMTDEEKNEGEIEELLNKNISSIALQFSGENNEYITDDLMWSVCSINKNLYSITLVLVPKVEQWDNGEVIVEKISLFSRNKGYEYALGNYKIEQKETLPESSLYVSLCSTETVTSENRIANIMYGIMSNNIEIEGFDIWFPKNFRDVMGYEVVSETYTEENGYEYYLDIELKNHNSKIVFRPFLKVEYEDGEGWLVPSVPVYFR